MSGGNQNPTLPLNLGSTFAAYTGSNLNVSIEIKDIGETVLASHNYVVNFTSQSSANNALIVTAGNAPLQLTFSNSGQTVATGSILVRVTNDRNRDITGVTGFGFAVPKSFGSTGAVLSGFSGSLLGASCSGGVSIDTTSSPDRNIFKCTFPTNRTFTNNAVAEFTISTVTNPSTPGRHSFEFLAKTNSVATVAGNISGEMFWGEAFIRDFTDVIAPQISTVHVVKPTELIVEFTEPIYVSNMA